MPPLHHLAVRGRNLRPAERVGGEEVLHHQGVLDAGVDVQQEDGVLVPVELGRDGLLRRGFPRHEQRRCQPELRHPRRQRHGRRGRLFVEDRLEMT
jgi:hypothetical protein